METWEASGIPVVERFRYLYSPSELAEWVPRIREAAEAAHEMHILMNNCYANYGSTNARELAVLTDVLQSSTGGVRVVDVVGRSRANVKVRIRGAT